MIAIKKKQKLFRVAEIIARAKVQPAQLSDEQAKDFTNIVSAGLVVIEDGQIAFATPELSAVWISHYCAARVSDVWEDLDQTAHELIKAYHLFRTLELFESATTQLFLSLKNDYGRDILTRLEEATHLEVGTSQANIPFNSIYFKFCDVLPELEYTPSDLADQLGPVLDATENYLPQGKLQVAIGRLAEQSQEKAEALLDTFLQRPEQRTVELAANSLNSLWKFDPTKAHRKAIELIKAEPESLRRVGSITLSWFDYELPSHEEKLKATIDHLEELCENKDTNLLSTIAQAFGNLLASLPQGSQKQRVQEEFLRLASYKEPNVQFVIAQSLSKLVADLGNIGLLWDALNYLSSIPAHLRGVLKELDFITYRIVNHDPKRVAEHLKDVVTSRNYGAEGGNDKLPDLYKDTVFCLVDKQQSVLESTITRWFASIDPRLHAAASDLVKYFVQEARYQPSRTIQLDSSELNLLDEENVQRVICALTGYVNDYKALASLLISVFSQKITGERIGELIVNALEQVVLYNMPGLGDEYLRGVTEDADVPEQVRQVVKNALERSNDYYKSLKGRSNLKELISPDIRVHRFHDKFQKWIYLHEERMSNESEFLRRIPKIHVKYGKASCSPEMGNAEFTNPMVPFYTDIEVPRESIIDPLGYRINRVRWQNMAVKGIPTKSKRPSTDH